MALFGFNRPQAISCLATPKLATQTVTPITVSIARRRLVVLRLPGLHLVIPKGVRFNRPQAISCLATDLKSAIQAIPTPFQSPAGD